MGQFKFKVEVWEYERGWGSKIDEVKEFDSYEEAEKFLNEMNAKNNQPRIPDWYMVAKRGNYQKS